MPNAEKKPNFSPFVMCAEKKDGEMDSRSKGRAEVMHRLQLTKGIQSSIYNPKPLQD